jgi:hypothetical protein
LRLCTPKCVCGTVRGDPSHSLAPCGCCPLVLAPPHSQPHLRCLLPWGGDSDDDATQSVDSFSSMPSQLGPEGGRSHSVNDLNGGGLPNLRGCDDAEDEENRLAEAQARAFMVGAVGGAVGNGACGSGEGGDNEGDENVRLPGPLMVACGVRALCFLMLAPSLSLSLSLVCARPTRARVPRRRAWTLSALRRTGCSLRCTARPAAAMASSM